jgi:hypothetical protein
MKLITRKSELALLSRYCNKVNTILTDHGLSSFTKLPWKFVMSIQNLEWGMPYTVADVIVIPQSLIASLVAYHKHHDSAPAATVTVVASDGTTKQNDKKDTTTGKDTLFMEPFLIMLLHERIHIVQRLAQPIFNLFYVDYFPFMTPIATEAEQRATLPAPENGAGYTENPDSNFSWWAYSYPVSHDSTDEKHIVPFLWAAPDEHSAASAPEEYAVEYMNPAGPRVPLASLDGDIPWSTLLSRPRTARMSLYHPNEIFASMVSNDMIMSGHGVDPVALTMLKHI